MSFAGIVMKEYYHDDNHHLQQQQTLRAVCWLYFSSSPSWWWSSRLENCQGLSVDVRLAFTSAGLSHLTWTHCCCNLITIIIIVKAFIEKMSLRLNVIPGPKIWCSSPCQTWRSRCAQLWSCHSLLLKQGAELLILLEMMLIILILILMHNCNAHKDMIWLWVDDNRMLWWHLM